MQEPRWTLDELADRVDAALAVDYHGQPSGRVRAVPDRRAIRWYTTIGLIDRPVAHRGRVALYGPRHLLQLVAVKRLQARGLPLVSIQQELAGATDTQLARVARLPAEAAPEPLSAVAVAPSEDGRSGKDLAGSAPATGVAPAAAAPRLAGGTTRRAAFWRDQPAAFTAAPAMPATPATPSGPPDPVGPAPGGLATLRGVRLGEGATLLLEPGRELGPDDIRAVLEAAGPLLAVLRDRGLGTQVPNPGPAARLPRGTEPRRERP
jgi:MerR HTH family regulatory protein